LSWSSSKEGWLFASAIVAVERRVQLSHHDQIGK
jgi:hypothetical protein